MAPTSGGLRTHRNHPGLRKSGFSAGYTTCRHTAVTKMAEAGFPESTMLAIMGHMSRAMLERYSHIRMKAKREAVESLATKREAPKPEAVPKETPKVAVPLKVQSAVSC